VAGTEGPVVREGQKKVSNACGAIEVLLGEIRSGVHQDGTIRDDNVEYDTLKKQIFSKVGLLEFCKFIELSFNLQE